MHNVITGRISNVKRLQNSRNGNPRYAIRLVNQGTFTTATDTGFVYAGIPTDGIVELTLNGRGTVVALERKAD